MASLLGGKIIYPVLFQRNLIPPPDGLGLIVEHGHYQQEYRHPITLVLVTCGSQTVLTFARKWDLAH
jgi:hypothetical protein